MPTPRQIQANQRNARASTGPRSDIGREASSRNALKHGIRAEKYLIVGEEEEFQQLLDALREHWAPMTALEERQVRKIAIYIMRLDRGARGEAEVIADTPLDAFFRGEQSALKNLLHYETVNRKGLRFEIELLERLQAQRLSGATESHTETATSDDPRNSRATGDLHPAEKKRAPSTREERPASANAIVQTNPIAIADGKSVLPTISAAPQGIDPAEKNQKTNPNLGGDGKPAREMETAETPLPR